MKDLGKKKLLIIMGGIIGLVVLIVIILLIYNTIFGKPNYKDIENTVLNAAKKYYNDNQTLLPKDETEEVRTTDSALTAAGYLKSMTELTERLEGATCTAEVVVNNIAGEYRYVALLNCGDKYSTKTLTSYIQENEPRVYTGEGLYDLNGELVYRGEDPANYVKFSGKTWRIVKIENDQVVMILNEKSLKTVWDDRFNTERNRNDGINDYTVSRINEQLNNLYQGDSIFNNDTRKLLSIHTLYTGKRYETDGYNDGSIEKSNFVERQYIGLLPLYDYINASIDTNCLSSQNASCTNYNYLNHFNYNWWTLTSDAANSYKVYRITDKGKIECLRASSYGYIRPVIYLVKDAIYVSGDGSIDNPYTIK